MRNYKFWIVGVAAIVAALAVTPASAKGPAKPWETIVNLTTPGDFPNPNSGYTPDAGTENTTSETTQEGTQGSTGWTKTEESTTTIDGTKEVKGSGNNGDGTTTNEFTLESTTTVRVFTNPSGKK